MNNAPSAARMPAAGTQALLSIRPGGQRLAAREVLAGRDRLERLAPGHGVGRSQEHGCWPRMTACPGRQPGVLLLRRLGPRRGGEWRWRWFDVGQLTDGSGC